MIIETVNFQNIFFELLILGLYTAFWFWLLQILGPIDWYKQKVIKRDCDFCVLSHLTGLVCLLSLALWGLRWPDVMFYPGAVIVAYIPLKIINYE